MSGPRVLVTYGSRHGSTAEIAVATIPPVTPVAVSSAELMFDRFVASVALQAALAVFTFTRPLT